MHKKKMTVLALASLMTLSLPLIAAEDTATGEGAEGDAAEAATEATGEDAGNPMSAMQERWRERNARYEELKARAKEAGVMLPEDPPWKSGGMGTMPGMGMMPGMADRMQQRQAMMDMSPEERMKMRESHYEAMRERAKERGIELPDTPPWEARQANRDQAWEKQQAVIDGMSDEERAACHAMHRRHMGMMMRDMPERPMMRGPGMGSGMGPGMGSGMGPGMGSGMGPGMGSGMGPGMGSGMGPGMMGQGMRQPGAMEPGRGPGYGYGPNPYGQPNFWDPNQ